MGNDNDSSNKIKMSSRLKGLFITNLPLKILSLFLAALVWTIIINIDDPIKEKSFNVEVDIINRDALESVNMVYEIKSGDIARITVKGKKSIIDKLRTDDLSAEADLSKLSSVNAVNITPKIVEKFAGEVSLSCDDVLKVDLEEMAKKQLQVQVVTEGILEEGYALAEYEVKPNMIEVTGGKTTINEITTLKATINVNKVSKSFSKKVEVKAYDENNEEVVSDTLEFSSKKVKVKCSVQETKTIPVNVEITGNPEEGYQYVSTECLPENVVIYGDEELLNKTTELTIPISIDGMNSKSDELEQNINAQEYLEQGLIVMPDYQTLSLKIDIEKTAQKTLVYAAKDVKFKNLTSGYKAKLLSNDYDKITVTVHGIKSVVKELTTQTLTVYVDCTSLEEGDYERDVKIYNDNGLTLIATGKIKFRVKKKATAISQVLESATPDDTIETTETEAPEATATPEAKAEATTDTDESTEVTATPTANTEGQ